MPKLLYLYRHYKIYHNQVFGCYPVPGYIMTDKQITEAIAMIDDHVDQTQATMELEQDVENAEYKSEVLLMLPPTVWSHIQ